VRRYRQIRVNGRHVLEHRHVWEQAYGQIPAGMVIHHRNEDRFDNRLENLELLSHREHSRHHNDKHPRVKTCEVCAVEYEPAPTKRASSKTCSSDCHRKRMSRLRPGVPTFAKLTEDDVREIKLRLARGDRPIDIARDFGVSRPNVSCIKHGRSWQHVQAVDVPSERAA
jgi:hypothetical protein